jgi:DNA gyrase subunit B
VAGALNPRILVDDADARALAEKIAARLNALSDETERGWLGALSDESGLSFTREVRGVKEAHAIDKALIASADARKLDQFAAHLKDLYGAAAVFRRKGVETAIFGPRSLLDAVYAAGRKGMTSMQRYKGLGEMNPEQLWETTLDVNVRTLLQVKPGELDEADEIFAKLMGDVVEPRRDFIQQNALNVANLDF